MKLIQALLKEGSKSSRAYREIKDKFIKQGAEAIGYGGNGVVFDSGDVGWVYKVTSDEIELEDVQKASGKKFKYLANIGEYYIHPSGEAGWYQVENLRDAPREIYSALKDGGTLFDFHKYVNTGDKKFLKDTPNIIKAGGKEYSLHNFFTGVRTEMLSANIDTDNIDLTGGQNNIMMDSKGNLRLIDY
jgi:hypothetical protein